MNKSNLVAIVILLSIIKPDISMGSEIDAATKVLNEHILRERGNGVVSHQEKCPKRKYFEYVTDFKFKPTTDGLVIGSVFVGSCPNGEGMDEYFVAVKNGRGRVIGREAIGAMNFMGDQYWIEGNILKVRGAKWVDGDPHCCPSKEGLLEYDLDTGRYKYNLRPVKPRN